MMVRMTMLTRCVLAILFLMTLFGGLTAQAQTSHASAVSQPNVQPPPPEDEPPFNNAEFVSQSVPTTMTAGMQYQVTVTMGNLGNRTWNEQEGYFLLSSHPAYNSTWGIVEVIPWRDNRPGALITFTFTVTAPSTPGYYDFQWQMVQQGVGTFGAPSTNMVINVVPPARVNGAVITEQNIPTQMTSGQSYAASVVVQNTGNTTWTAGEKYSFGIPGVNGVQLWHSGRVALPNAVEPGGVVAFYFQIVAPGPGTHHFVSQMVQDDVEWFGQSTNAPVNVAAPPTNGATFTTQSVPTTLIPGQIFPVSVTMLNSGTTTWRANQYGLGSLNPQDNSIWGTDRMWITVDVPPGSAAVFNVDLRAPTAAGSYNFQWQMLQPSCCWFGPATPNIVVSVAPAGSQETVTYIHTDGLGSPVARTDSAGNVISRTHYEPYGRTAGGVEPTIGFTGHVNDADIGLVYMQQRYYDPIAGRFLSIDPVTTDANTGGSFNRYAYANNSPYKYIDPDGREVKVVGSDDFKKQVAQNIKQIESGSNGNALMQAANETPRVITITETKGGNFTATSGTADKKPADSKIGFAPNNKEGGKDATGSTNRPAYVGLAHEMGHAVAAAKGEQSFDKGSGRPGTTPPSEKQSMKAESGVRQDHKLPERPSYY